MSWKKTPCFERARLQIARYIDQQRCWDLPLASLLAVNFLYFPGERVPAQAKQFSCFLPLSARLFQGAFN